jgi:hypothetical protein
VIRDHHRWRYLDGGDRKHALLVRGGRVAYCGNGPFWSGGDWLGTLKGAQRGRLAVLPYCPDCLDILGDP